MVISSTSVGDVLPGDDIRLKNTPWQRYPFFFYLHKIKKTSIIVKLIARNLQYTGFLRSRPATLEVMNLPSNTLGLLIICLDVTFLFLGAVALGIRLKSRSLLKQQLRLNDHLALLAWVRLIFP